MEAAIAVLEIGIGSRIDADVVLIKLDIRGATGMCRAVRCHQAVCRGVVPIYDGISAPPIHATDASKVGHCGNGDGVILKEQIICCSSRRWRRRWLQRTESHERGEITGRRKSVVIYHPEKIIREVNVTEQYKYVVTGNRSYEVVVVDAYLLSGPALAIEPDQIVACWSASEIEIEPGDAIEFVIDPRQIVHS